MNFAFSRSPLFTVFEIWIFIKPSKEPFYFEPMNIVFANALKLERSEYNAKARSENSSLSILALLHLCLTLGFCMTNVLKVCNFQKRKLHLLHQMTRCKNGPKISHPQNPLSISVTKLCKKVRVLAQYICLRKLSICYTMYHE